MYNIWSEQIPEGSPSLCHIKSSIKWSYISWTKSISIQMSTKHSEYICKTLGKSLLSKTSL